MNKTQLKEAVRSVLAQRLAEAKGQTPAKYGYVLSDKNTPDPRLQLIGYGNMPASRWKEKIVKDLEELIKHVKSENYRGAAHLVAPNGVLHSEINMMKEVFEKDL